MTDDVIMPLDPEEGPTLWLRIVDEETISLLVGNDPNNPFEQLALNRQEVERIHEYVERHLDN